MKKSISISALTLLASCVFAQGKTLNNSYNDIPNGRVIVNYTNEIGEQKAISIPTSTFHGTDSTRYKNYNKILQDRLDTITVAKAKIVMVIFTTNNSVTNGVFVVTGQYYPPKLMRVGQLSSPDSTLVAQFAAFVLSYTSVALTSCSMDLSTCNIYINSVLYDASVINTASGGLLTQLKTMCTNKFNP